MADICNAGSTGSRAFTGLVGEQSALDTRHHHGAKGTTGELPEAKSILNDKGEHTRHKLNVHGKDDQRQKNIEHGHHRHEDAADLGDAVDTTKNAGSREYDKDESHQPRLYAEGSLHGSADGVALYGDVSHAKGDGDQHGIETCHPTFVQAKHHIVGRAADIAPLSFALIELGQRRLHEGSSRTEQGDDPHPEDGTRPAYSNSCSHTGKVACTHT